MGDLIEYDDKDQQDKKRMFDILTTVMDQDDEIMNLTSENETKENPYLNCDNPIFDFANTVADNSLGDNIFLEIIGD